MDLAALDLQIQNKIIMYQVPIYPYINEINHLAQWFDEWDNQSVNTIDWLFDAIKLKKDIEREILEIRFKNFRYSWYN